MPSNLKSHDHKGHKKRITISEWMKKREFYKYRKWSLVNGIMTTQVDGKIYTQKQFEKKYPVPSVSNFSVNMENPNSNKLCLH